MSSFSNTNKEDDANNATVLASHLDWSNQQKRILTGGDRADELYTAQRGFPFRDDELPHHYLKLKETHSVFKDWKKKEGSNNNDNDPTSTIPTLVGAWQRLIFFGGWEHTSIKDERTYNLQTRGLFIDLRIPRTRDVVLASLAGKSSLEDLTKEELRCYARQHVFAGYTKVEKSPTNNSNNDLLCTRHHCIDWNFVGSPRSRPNKWYAELQPTDNNNDNGQVKTWKEWTFAKDDRGQHYYCEQWERLPQGQATPMLALRTVQTSKRDGIILVVGDHFNFVFSRDLSNRSAVTKMETYLAAGHTSTVGMVDAALEQDELETARTILSIRGGHGIVNSEGWIVDCAIEPWMEGKPFCNNNATEEASFSIRGAVREGGQQQIGDCQVVWKEHVFDVFDTNLQTLEELATLLQTTAIITTH